jgi:hypothetical protein
MQAKRAGVLVRAATRDDIARIVSFSNASVDETEDVGFGTPRSESMFADAQRLSAAWETPNAVPREAELVVREGAPPGRRRHPGGPGHDLELINIDVPCAKPWVQIPGRSILSGE